MNKTSLSAASLKGNRHSFPVPEDLSSNWTWDGKWYTMRMGDASFLDHEYYRRGGKHPHGPTHAEKIELFTSLGWMTRTINGTVHVVPPKD